jgi:hypothetical protein
MARRDWPPWVSGSEHAAARHLIGGREASHEVKRLELPAVHIRGDVGETAKDVDERVSSR